MKLRKMRRIIIYYSKTGFTARYAKWLQEDLGCFCVPWEEARKKPLDQYDQVIFASWIHAGKIQKLSWLMSQGLGGEKAIVLVTGAAPKESPETEKTIAANFGEKRSDYAVFYLQSGLDYGRMSLGDRWMMKAFCKVLEGKKDKSPSEQEMAERVRGSFDCSERAYLQPVLDYIG